MSKDYVAALAKVYRMQQTAEDKRRAVSARLQQVAPDLLQDMQKDQHAFGKFEASIIEINGETVYERGELAPVRMKWDGKMRPTTKNIRYR